MSNLGPQFTAYRGLIVARGPVPDSDEEILGHLRAGGRHPFGQHWTTDQKTAERFATTPNAGGYETQPVHMRQYNDGNHYGVVIEGRIHTDRAVHETNIGANAGEREISPLAHELHSATAHVMHRSGGEERSAAFRAGQSLAGLPKVGALIRDRSIEIPPEKWR